MLIISDIPLEQTKLVYPLHYSKIKQKSTNVSVDLTILSEQERFAKLLHRLSKSCLMTDGIGIAASQLGIFKKLFLIRNFKEVDEKVELFDSFQVFVNAHYEPVIDGGKSKCIEGCLSVPGKSFIIERWNKINASWLEPEFETSSFKFHSEIIEGYRARCFQHEFSHGLGKSIIDTFNEQNKK